MAECRRRLDGQGRYTVVGEYTAPLRRHPSGPSSVTSGVWREQPYALKWVSGAVAACGDVREPAQGHSSQPAAATAAAAADTASAAAAVGAVLDDLHRPRSLGRSNLLRLRSNLRLDPRLGIEEGVVRMGLGLGLGLGSRVGLGLGFGFGLGSGLGFGLGLGLGLGSPWARGRWG